MSGMITLLLLLYLISYQLAYLKKIEDISTCLNETDCNESDFDEYTTNTTSEASTTTKKSQSTTVTILDNVTISTQVPVSTTAVPLPDGTTRKSRLKGKNRSVHKKQSDICECDLTVLSCDINCCCDTDCKEFHLTAFSHCKDVQPDLYDSRYCYHTNFIDRNNTPFVLEKLAGNLFCILYDNLPPTYSTASISDIKNYKDLKIAINQSKSSWTWETFYNAPDYNISSAYQDGDIVWILDKNGVKPLELLQTGFTGLCSFKKTAKYLQEWKDSCMQTTLDNTNTYLFSTAYNNFYVISSPLLFNKTYMSMADPACARNICLPIVNYYCTSFSDVCNTTEIPGSCLNGTCNNIVLGVQYLIKHNGSMGISSINAYFKIGNVTSKFRQHFEFIYEWINMNSEKMFVLSGNPGYIQGKPIIIGTSQINKTGDMDRRYIKFDRSDNFLTLPFSQRTGECSQTIRYPIAFGEDIKLKCSLFLQTNNFSSTTCIELQNHTLHLLIQDSLFNISQVDQYNIYVSQLGNFTHNDTSKWVQILLDRIPQNVITGQLSNHKIRCSGLITSFRVDILYSTLPKPESLTNYNILAVGFTFSDEIDITWPKCIFKNCTDVLKVDIISYVRFHDVTKPSKYYFVGAPHLDITLPYDFFYPFLSRSTQIEPFQLLIGSVIFTLFL